MLPLTVLCLCLPSAAPPAREPLPEHAIARLGHARLFAPGPGPLHASPDGRLAVRAGQWLDLVAGRTIPSPLRIPDGYVFHQFLTTGHVVKGRDDYLVFSAKADRPRAGVVTANAGAAFDADGRYCLDAGERQGKDVVRLANLRDGGTVTAWRTLATLAQSVDAPTRPVRLSESGSHVTWWDAAASRLGVHDVAANKTFTAVVRLDPSDRVRAVAVSPEGELVACACYRNVRFHETVTGHETRQARGPATIWLGDRCDFTADGKHLVRFDNDGYRLIPTDPADAASEVAVRGDQHALFRDGRRLAAVDEYGVVRVHDLKTGRRLDAHSRYEAFAGVQMLSGHRAASWSRSGRFVVWDVRDGRPLSEARVTLKDDLVCMQFAADGGHLAAWSSSRCVLADAGGKIVAEIAGHSPLSTTFDASGKYLGILTHPDRGERATALLVHGLPKGGFVRKVPLPSGKAILSGNGRAVFVAGHYSVSAHDARSGKARWDEELPDGDDPCLAALDGRRAVVVRRQDAFVLDAATGRTLACIVCRSDYLGEEARPAATAGRWLVVKNRRRENRISVYDLDARVPDKAVLSTTLPGAAITALAVDANGSRLLTAHGDGTCVVWDLKRLLASPR